MGSAPRWWSTACQVSSGELSLPKVQEAQLITNQDCTPAFPQLSTRARFSPAWTLLMSCPSLLSLAGWTALLRSTWGRCWHAALQAASWLSVCCQRWLTSWAGLPSTERDNSNNGGQMLRAAGPSDVSKETC